MQADNPRHLQTDIQKNKESQIRTHMRLHSHMHPFTDTKPQRLHVDNTRNLQTQRVLRLSSSSNLFKQTKNKKYHYYVFTDKLGAFFKKCIYLNVINCSILANPHITAMFPIKVLLFCIFLVGSIIHAKQMHRP